MKKAAEITPRTPLGEGKVPISTIVRPRFSGPLFSPIRMIRKRLSARQSMILWLIHNGEDARVNSNSAISTELGVATTMISQELRRLRRRRLLKVPKATGSKLQSLFLTLDGERLLGYIGELDLAS